MNRNWNSVPRLGVEPRFCGLEAGIRTTRHQQAQAPPIKTEAQAGILKDYNFEESFADLKQFCRFKAIL